MDHVAREKILKETLPIEKVKLIDRYGLICDENLRWISKKENSHEQIVFNNSFLLKADLLGLIFRINKLCFAKLKYFRNHIDEFEPYIYSPTNGFEKTEWWNSDFLKHSSSGIIVDYRFLQRITKIEEFREFCNYLEKSHI